MNFTVVWHPSADDALADLWLRADSAAQSEITAATHQADQALRSNPQTAGESRQGNIRALFIAPPGFLYEVHEDDRLVRVLAVWRTR